jgi:pimeloyl-ACP methyl ester carboxylesterase
VLRSLAGGTMFGELWGTAPAQVLALHGWGRSHDDFFVALAGAPPAGPPLAGAPPAGSPPAGAPPAGPPLAPVPAAPAQAPRDEPLDVLAPDLPGFGASPPPPAPWGTAQYAEALVALFDPEAGLLCSPAVVVGHSFGGRVALQLAVRHPELVDALVLSGVPLLPVGGRRPRPAVAYRVLRSLHRAGLVGEGRMERARQRYGSSDYRHARGVMRGVLVAAVGESYEEQLTLLARRRCPVELVWGEDDVVAPLEVAEKAAARLPGAHLTRCAGAGHLTPLTAPHELRVAVERAASVARGSG